jgi:hypothetical protein
MEIDEGINESSNKGFSEDVNQGVNQGVNRRTLLKSAVVAGAAPTALWFGAGAARASATYGVAVSEQYHNQIQIYSSSTTWGSPQWAWSPGSGGWSNLSDITFRNTASFGEVALVTASGGNVGIVDKAASGTQGTGSLLWAAAPGDNPHAIERIPNIRRDRHRILRRLPPRLRAHRDQRPEHPGPGADH